MVRHWRTIFVIIVNVRDKNTIIGTYFSYSRKPEKKRMMILVYNMTNLSGEFWIIKYICKIIFKPVVI